MMGGGGGGLGGGVEIHGGTGLTKSCGAGPGLCECRLLPPAPSTGSVRCRSCTPTKPGRRGFRALAIGSARSRGSSVFASAITATTPGHVGKVVCDLTSVCVVGVSVGHPTTQRQRIVSPRRPAVRRFFSLSLSFLDV